MFNCVTFLLVLLVPIVTKTLHSVMIDQSEQTRRKKIDQFVFL